MPQLGWLRQAVDASGEVIFLTDVEGTFTFVNPQFERTYGYTAAEVQGRMNAAELGVTGMPERDRQEFWDRLHRGEFINRTFVNRTRDGRVIEVDSSISAIRDVGGTIVGYLAIQRDISERKRAEEAKREYEHRLLVAVASANVALFAQDTDLRYTWVHNVHFPEQDALGHTDHDLFPPELAGKIVELKRRALRTGERVREEIVGVFRGQLSSLELFVEPLRSAEGKIEGLTGAAIDTGPRRKLEEQLRQAQKLEAIGSLAGGIAHDFNNLLTAILGYAELACDALPADHPAIRELDQVLRAAHSAEALTRQLLIFSRKSHVRPVELRLNEVVARLHKILRRVVGEHIRFHLELGSDMHLVLADAGQIEQVLMNLVVNARDAMPAGGDIHVRTGCVELDDAFARRHGGTNGGLFEWLSVTDNGIGMTPDVLAQVFDPFFTTKGAEKGTGLGLATVHGIVRQAGGYVHVESAPGRGSTFTVYLPRLGREEPLEGPVSQPPAPARGSETILFVEDDDSIRTMGVRALEQFGYSVLAAANADEALVASGEYLGRIDVLVTDVVMPGLNGRALAEIVREARPGIRIIYTSGFTEDSELLQDVRSGGAPLIQKPYGIDGLARTVRAVLDS